MNRRMDGSLSTCADTLHCVHQHMTKPRTICAEIKNIFFQYTDLWSFSLTPITMLIALMKINGRLSCFHSCWLHDEALYYGFLLPVGLIILINAVLYSMAIYRITCGRVTSSTALTHSTKLRASILLFVLIGMLVVYVGYTHTACIQQLMSPTYWLTLRYY